MAPSKNSWRFLRTRSHRPAPFHLEAARQVSMLHPPPNFRLPESTLSALTLATRPLICPLDVGRGHPSYSFQNMYRPKAPSKSPSSPSKEPSPDASYRTSARLRSVPFRSAPHS